ncbi:MULTISPECIES: hypothetical protein [Cohaesibacter]|nr:MULTISPECIES: hypothetical protein [Cohaesibacter]
MAGVGDYRSSSLPDRQSGDSVDGAMMGVFVIKVHDRAKRLVGRLG